MMLRLFLWCQRAESLWHKEIFLLNICPISVIGMTSQIFFLQILEHLIDLYFTNTNLIV